MTYVDSFIIPVPKRSTAAYKKLARMACKIWMDHGALHYFECLGDEVPVGKRTSFPRSVKLTKTEQVWSSFIVYKSRKHRDRVMANVMDDPRAKKMMLDKKLPFDPKRMIVGGFKTVVEAHAE